MERLKHDQFVKSSQCTISFNSQLASLKSSLGLWEDMITKTSKLSASLKTVIQCIGGFLEAFQKIADCAYSSNCGLRELGSSMTRFCLRERGLESRLRTFNSQLNECLTAPLIDRLEEWKRTVAQLDRENGKEWRRAKSELQRATCELEKLSKRSRRKGSAISSNGVGDFDSHNEIHAFKTLQSNDSNNNNNNNNNGILQSGDNMHLNFAQHDLILKQRTLAELERVSLRRAVIEERRRFAELLTCLKPVLDSKLAIFGDVNLFEESILAITHNSYDPNQIPDEIEEAIDYAVGHVTSSLTSSDRKYSTSAFGAGAGGGVGGCSSRSESRCTLRSTKQQQQHSGIGCSSSPATTGSGLDISNQHNNYYSSSGSGLSCHASELSLQSSISVSTNSSWNNNNIGSGNSNGNNNNNNNNPSYNNHSQSTIHASNQHCDALNSTNINNTVMPDSMSSHTHAGVGDSVSLFENPEGSISGESGSSGRPVQNSVLDSINTDWIPLPGLTNKDGNFNDRKIQHTNTAAASAAFAAAEGGYTSENGNIRDDDDNDVGDVDDSHDVTSISGGDIADRSGGCGGGTTATTNDDTDDGETDDEKLDQSSQDLSKSRQTPMLYPNQAIPAPVYTNLNELKKAAARKFQNRQNSPTVTSTNNNSNNNNNETVNSISNSLYAGRKFSLQLNDSVITSSPQPPPPPSIPPIGAGNGHAEESYAVANMNKFDPNLSQSSQVIWPSIVSSGKEFDGEKCYTPPASTGVVGGLTAAPLSDIITRSNNNNNNNSNNKSNNNMHNSWEYDHNHNHAALLNQSTYQINKSSSLLLSSQSTTTVGQLPITPSTPFASGVGVSVGGSTCDLLQSNVTVGGGGGSSTNDNEYITTCVNSGTSTFRRRQSEYFKKSLDCGTNPGLCPSSPPLSSSLRNSNYASIVTPGLIRRGSQAAYQQQTSHVGRLCDRPIHPPRRSSSVSREIVSHNNNNMLMNSNNTQISHNSNQHYSRLNLSDFAGNKNPSPFTLSHESGNNNNNFNNNSRLQSNPYMNSTPPTPPPPPTASSSPYQQQQQQQQQYQQKSLSFQQTNQNMPQQYSYRQQQQHQQCYQEPSGPLPVSSSSTSSASNVNNSPGSRLISGSNMDGSQNGNNGNNNSQLMFGVKVLPNITPPTLLGNNPIGSQSRLPQRSLIRQASCEPLGGAGAGTGNMMTTDRQTHQHYMQQQQQQQSHYAVTGGVGGVHSPRKNFYSHQQQQQQQQQQGVPMMSQPSSIKSKNQSFTDDGVTSFID